MHCRKFRDLERKHEGDAFCKSTSKYRAIADTIDVLQNIKRFN